jgi:hypothetical protein
MLSAELGEGMESEGARIDVRNDIVIARNTSAAHRRLDEALGGWRADPPSLRAAYEALVASRHPTVSGAPPRVEDREPPEGR